MSAGIDYGLGRTNVDHASGIRYGVISQHSVSQAWSDSAEPDYGPPTCPKCDGRAMSYLGIHESFEQYSVGCADYACEDCEITFDSCEAFPDEAGAWNYAGDGYEMSDCLDSDIMITASPYFTYAPYCSPCVPGAGNLDSASERDELDGVRTYCVGHDWFEDGFAPYEVFDVATGKLVPRPPTGVCYAFNHHAGGYYLYASTSPDVRDAPFYRSFWIVPGTLDPTI